MADKNGGIPAWLTALLIVFSGVVVNWWNTETVKEDVPQLQADVRTLDTRLDRQADRLTKVIGRQRVRVNDLRVDIDENEEDVTVLQQSVDDLLTLFADEAAE